MTILLSMSIPSIALRKTNSLLNTPIFPSSSEIVDKGAYFTLPLPNVSVEPLVVINVAVSTALVGTFNA